MVADARMLKIVTELLHGGHGETSVLTKIKRAAVQDEVISVNERMYVESLAEKFLFSGRKVPAMPEPVVEREKPIVPQKAQRQVRAEVSGVRRSKKPGKKILAAIAFIFVIAGAGAAVYYYGADFTYVTVGGTEPDAAAEFSIETDASAYEIGDIISVSGYSEEDVKVSVLDSKYNIVWFEEIPPDASGQYSVLIIAGGEGWTGGAYTVMASSGTDSQSAKINVG